MPDQCSQLDRVDMSRGIGFLIEIELARRGRKTRVTVQIGAGLVLVALAVVTGAHWQVIIKTALELFSR